MKKTALLLLAALSIAVPAALAQDAPAPPPTPKTPKPPAREMKREVHVERRMMGPDGGMGMGMGPGGGMPQGAWWKNPDVAQKINLSADQQKRIEDIFMQTRVQLIHAHAALEEQELMLEPLMSANPIDQGKALAQINKIADLRADLEKTNAKMLLGIRGVLAPDQWTKLQEMHHSFMRGPMHHMDGHDGRMRHDGPDGSHGRTRGDGPPSPSGPSAD